MKPVSVSDTHATAQPLRPRRVAHVVYSFHAGGLENVLVQLINHLPYDGFQHLIIALTTFDPNFIKRIVRSDVEVLALHKPPGQIFQLYPKLWRILRTWRPDVLHTCNLAALEVTPLAWLAGVKQRVHVEHGWTVDDPDGSNRRYRFLRRLYRPFVSRFVAVSAQLRDYLAHSIGVTPERLSLISNGVDVHRFRPLLPLDNLPQDWPFQQDDWVIATVGRLDPVKNQTLLIEAFAQILRRRPELSDHLGLAIVGDGGERARLVAKIAELGVQERVHLLGNRSDIPAILRTLHCFVLPSLAEGTSCTLQEAMASGVAIVATEVGGNRDLLGETCGQLVPSNDVAALTSAILQVYDCAPEIIDMPEEARRVALTQHALFSMVQAYENLFNGVRP